MLLIFFEGATHCIPFADKVIGGCPSLRPCRYSFIIASFTLLDEST